MTPNRNMQTGVGPTDDSTRSPVEGEPWFFVMAVGLIYATVCTDLDDDEAAARLNLLHPTGIGSPWTPSSDSFFADGIKTNPCACENDPRFHHRLFSC